LDNFKDKELIQQVWDKGLILPGYDKDAYRADHCGAIIQRDMYNDTSGPLSMGWEIDRIKPLSYGGTSDLSNLQPLQWENNRKKNEDYPSWSCRVKASDQKNIYINKS
jgi:hypothetical protein